MLFLCITSSKFHSSSSVSADGRCTGLVTVLGPAVDVEPFVEDALCVSFDELVSVEKPESCTTLPLLPSPLFGSFLPLCELLRLRISDDDDVSPTVADSFCTNLRRTRIPGSHSRLNNRNKNSNVICNPKLCMPRITHLDANDDDDGTPVIVLDADIDAILFLRSGNVSMTRSRNSNNAPTSFCNSCE